MRDNKKRRAMQTRLENSTRKSAHASVGGLWLRKHGDYQRVYREGQRRSLPLMTYFFAPQCATGNGQSGPRVGLTVGRALGNAVKRNRIKRRMREVVRRHCAELTANVDIVLHPRKAVFDAPFADIERDVVNAFRTTLKTLRPG